VSEQPVFDLVLVGYRDDQDRERALALLARLGTRYPLATTGRDTPLPHCLLAGVDHPLGLALCAQLRGAGARVHLVAAEAEEPACVPSTRVPHGAPLRMVVLLLFLATVGVLQASRDRSAAPRVAGGGVQSEPEAASSDPVARSARENNEAVALSEEGDFANAANRLRDAIRSEPGHPGLRANLRVVLHNWAVAELNEGRPENASGLIQEALQLGEDPRLLFVLGIAMTRTGDLAGARKALERALAMDASDVRTLLTLGRLYQQSGYNERAVEMFQRARDLGASDPDFTISLQRLERALDAEWDYTELPSRHFTVSFAEGKNAAAARRVIESLEDAYFSVGRKFDFYPSAQIPVVLYDSEEFHDITMAPSWMGALYDGRIKLPVHGLEKGSHPLLDRSVRHEYAHAVVGELTRGNCPVWLNEGLAMWAEESLDGERLDWAEAALGGREPFPLDTLRGSFSKIPPERVPVAYAQSYLAVRHLLRDFGPGDVRDLLNALGAGTPLPQAFEAVFARSLADFEDDVTRGLVG
jgi:tetratricopeptide (TPR) repeat protein